MGNEVDAWMAKYDNPQKQLVEAVRRAILAADTRIGECIKWQAPTFTYKGNLASFYPKARAHVSLMFHTGAQIAGDFPALEGTGDVSRVMKFADAADLERKAPELARLVKTWCDQRDGG
jgi:hypothetical protein